MPRASRMTCRPQRALSTNQSLCSEPPPIATWRPPLRLSSSKKISAVAFTADSFLFSRLDAIVAFAGRNHLPTMGVERQFTLTGGLMAYGPDSGEAFRQGGVYTGRILRGERPADLPVMQPTKF